MNAPLTSCSSCAGFVPAAASACPHCDAARPRRRGPLARTLASLIGGGAFAVTLMACYGAMPHRAEGPDSQACGYGSADGDGDGACPPQDCNDTDRAIYPGAEDPDLDAIDQNCDGVDGWRDPGSVATPPPGDLDAGAAPVEPVPIAADPAVAPTP